MREVPLSRGGWGHVPLSPQLLNIRGLCYLIEDI